MCNYCGKTFFTWDHFVFLFYRTNGRISRRQFFIALLFPLAFLILFCIVTVLVFYFDMEYLKNDPAIISTVYMGLCLPLFVYWYWSIIALVIKRLKDTNSSPWNAIFTTFFPWIFPRTLLFKKGDKGDNQYGPDPESKEKIGFLKKVKIKERMGILP